MEENVMGAVTLFIGIVILISIAPLILGNTTNDCEEVAGFHATDATKHTGWAKACISAGETNQSSFSIVAVIPLVVAAVGVMLVMRYL